MLGEHDSIQKANDDGEPSGTAGVPILEFLKLHPKRWQQQASLKDGCIP